MKLNKDNYELVMFDLLEGNLSEKDELLVMQQIEEDDFLFREWKLFKSTVLIADKDVVYSAKSSLLKDEGAVATVPMYRKWIAVAASVCILAAALLLWPSTDEVGPVVDAEVEIPSTVDPVIETPEVDKEKVVAVEQMTTEPQFTVETIKERIKESKVQKSQPNFISAPKDIKDARDESDKNQLAKHYENLEKEKGLIHQVGKDVEVQKPEELIVIQPKTYETVVDNSAPEKPESMTRKEILKEFVTKTPPRRIKEKAIGIIALVSNPRIKFKPHFKGRKPSLEIELETTGYQAIASIEPFKNKN